MSRITNPALVMGLILALAAAMPAQGNGGFESGLVNWTAIPGAATTITSASSALFPSEGSSYAVVNASSSNAAIAGHGPHLGGGGFNATSKLVRNFTRPAGSNCWVGIDWTFILHEAENDASNNDFLSIDIIDVNTGTLVKNMVFVDNGTSGGTPAYNGVPGSDGGNLTLVRSFPAPSIIIIGGTTIRLEPSPAGFKRAQCDISNLTSVGQQLRIEIAVGNGGDDANDSRAYVDNFTVRTGGDNSNTAAFRVLGDNAGSVYQSFSTTESDRIANAPFEMALKPGGNGTLYFGADPGPQGFALLVGTFKRDATSTVIGELNLVQSLPINVPIDGLNPTTPADVLLGTIGAGPKFLDITVPETVTDGSFGMQAVVANPTAGPIFLELTAATNVVIRNQADVPLGTSDVLDAGGATLSDDDSGVISLADLNGGAGFEFYGISYTQCHVNSNGNITFGSGDTDFSESVNELYTDQPRIAPLWDDFNPTAGSGGAVRWRVNGGSGPFSPSTTAITISWENLAAFSQAANGNTFSVVLYEDGTIEYHYDRLNESDGIVGISRGGLSTPTTPPSGVNFSQLSSFHRGENVNYGSAFPIFEQFENGQDLLTLGLNGRSTLTFEPRYGPNPEFPILIEFQGYKVFSGTGSN